MAVARRSEDAFRARPAGPGCLGDAEGAYRASLARILGRLQGQQAQSTLTPRFRLQRGRPWPPCAPSNGTTPAPRHLYQVAKSDAGTSRKVLALRGFIRQAGMEGKTDPQGTVRRLQEAMDMAIRDEERRMVLAELAKIPDPAALAVVLKYTESESLGSEAIAAAMDIVEPIAGSHRETVMPVLEKYGPKLRDPKERAAASELLSKLRQAGGFLTTWQVAGPFRAEGRNAVGLIDTPFAPETGGSVEWRELRLPASSETPGFVSLARVGGELPRVAYLKTSVQCARSREVTLAVGSDDGLKVWLNGQVVHSAAVLRGAVADADKIKVRLQAGTNSLMLKVSDAGGGWGVFCRFLDDHGKPIEDLAVGGR
ncbi:hypothetical protein HS125_05010 [bacterium]|nr:hypothetical protein [bacterium]